MDHFSDEHSNLLLSQAWLVKIDAANSTPYLIKFCTSAFNMNCCVVITDTKRTWAEVLTRKEFARRWRDCNPKSVLYTSNSGEEDSWRTSILELLTKAHTLGSFSDISFEVVESNYSDFAFELDCETFKWRWETNFLGYKTSTEILSKHLIVPLISTNHLAFSSPDPVCELSENDLQQAVDKMGRTAKRSADIHLRNALSKPRVATTLRRVTSVLNAISDIPPISFAADKPDLQLPMSQRAPERQRASRPVSPLLPPSDVQPIKKSPSPLPIQPPEQKMPADSATESDEEAQQLPRENSTRENSTRENSIRQSKTATTSDSHSAGPSAKSTDIHPSRKDSPSSAGAKQSKGTPSDSDSSPARPVKKKLKQISSSDDDDGEVERRKEARGGAPARRGTRQPIKRGGKRF